MRVNPKYLASKEESSSPELDEKERRARRRELSRQRKWTPEQRMEQARYLRAIRKVNSIYKQTGSLPSEVEVQGSIYKFWY